MTKFTPLPNAHAAAKRQYPWLRLDNDPRKERAQAEDGKILTKYSHRLSDLVTMKSQMLTQLKTLKHQNANRERIADLERKVKKIEARITSDFKFSKGVAEQITLTPKDAWRKGLSLPIFRHRYREYLFGGRELTESHTLYLDFACPNCQQRVRRTKREIDVGSGVKLYAFSCHCFSFLINKHFLYVTLKTWARIAKDHDNDE